MSDVLAEVQRKTAEVLLSSAKDFRGQVEATAHLDRKVLVAGHLPPREVDSAQFVPWEQLCRCWGIKVVGSLSARYFAVELPFEWRLQPVAAGSLWSLILDEGGRERASVYYRPAHGEYSALFYLNHRFNIFSHYLDPTDHTVRIISARDGQRIFHEFGRVAPTLTVAEYWMEVAMFEATAQNWFDQEYPGWRSPFAYWELYQ